MKLIQPIELKGYRFELSLQTSTPETASLFQILNEEKQEPVREILRAAGREIVKVLDSRNNNLTTHEQ